MIEFLDLFPLSPPPPSLVGEYYLQPPEARAIFSHNELPPQYFMLPQLQSMCTKGKDPFFRKYYLDLVKLLEPFCIKYLELLPEMLKVESSESLMFRKPQVNRLYLHRLIVCFPPEQNYSPNSGVYGSWGGGGGGVVVVVLYWERPDLSCRVQAINRCLRFQEFN